MTRCRRSAVIAPKRETAGLHEGLVLRFWERSPPLCMGPSGRVGVLVPHQATFALVALRAGVTETDCVVPPERLCIDQCPCHPRLILRELDGLEGTIRNAQGWFPEALVATGRKPET